MLGHVAGPGSKSPEAAVFPEDASRPTESHCTLCCVVTAWMRFRMVTGMLGDLLRKVFTNSVPSLQLPGLKIAGNLKATSFICAGWPDKFQWLTQVS